MEFKNKTMGLIFVALTVLFTVYGQLIIKWQVGGRELPPGLVEKLTFVLSQYLNPWVISAFVSGFIASMAWIAAMTQLELSFAYPFMSTSLVIVVLFSIIVFGESFAWTKIIGTGIIIVGLIILTK